MMEGRRFVIILLDERRIELIVQPRLMGGDLLDLAASHAIVKEKDYFGLVYIDESSNFLWLKMDRKVLDHEFWKPSNSTVTLHFMVKFFVDSISQIRDIDTIELFYLQARNALIKGQFEIDTEVVFRLAAFALQATYGDYSDDEAARQQLKRLPVLPTSALKELPSLQLCEDRVIEHYKKLEGHNRGLAIISYLTLVENQPTYGVHYYKVVDKNGLPCFLGISHRGIAQYDFCDRRTPRLVFLWKQLENLYFRDRKLSVEVHDPKRVVHALSSFNLYEDAIENSAVHKNDDLLHAICDVTTQVSVSRRTFGPGQVTVNVWYGDSQIVTKSVWSMAVDQYQFYLDKKRQKFCHKLSSRDLTEVANDLSFNKSSQSLSNSSSTSNLSSGDSPCPLNARTIEISEGEKAARMEIMSALNARREALEAKLIEKTAELKLLCVKEGELTGILPSETPLSPGEALPNLKRRIGTSFSLPDSILNKIKCREEEVIAALELDYEIQKRIVSASWRLCCDCPPSKSLRKKRRQSYQQSQEKLRGIEEKLSRARAAVGAGSSLPSVCSNWSAPGKQRKKPRPTPRQDDYGENESCRQEESPSRSSHDSDKPPLPPGGIEDEKPTEMRKSVSMSVPSSPSKPHSRAWLASEPSDGIPNLHRCLSGGYITSSMSRRSSYRCKQYPMLSRGSSTQGETSPYYNKYETSLNPGDVSAALYNIPRQRISLAFQSLDDLDGGETRTTTRFGSLDRRRDVNPKMESRSVDALDGLDEVEACIDNPQLSPLETKETRHRDSGYGSNMTVINDPQDPSHLKYDTPARSRAVSGDSNVSQSGRVIVGQEAVPKSSVMETHFYTFNQDNIQSMSANMSSLMIKRDRHPSCDPVSPNLVSKERAWKETSLDIPLATPSHPHHLNDPQDCFSNSAPYTKNLDLNLSPLESSDKRRPAPESSSSPLRVDLNDSCVSDPLDKGGCEIPCESPKNQTVVSAGRWQPYREISKPFEMADFYKYSTKFRKNQLNDSSRTQFDESKWGHSEESTNAPDFSLRVNSFTSVRSPDSTNTQLKPQQHGIYQPLSPLSCEPLHRLATDLTPRLSRANSLNGAVMEGTSGETVEWFEEKEPVNPRSATLV